MCLILYPTRGDGWNHERAFFGAFSNTHTHSETSLEATASVATTMMERVHLNARKYSF